MLPVGSFMMKNWIGTFLVGLGVSVASAVVYEKAIKTPPSPPPSTQPARPAKIKLYVFTAEWCMPCKRLHQEMKDPAVQKALERFEVIESEKPPKDRHWSVTAYPTLIADATAGPVKKTGFMTADQLVEWLNSIKQ